MRNASQGKVSCGMELEATLSLQSSSHFKQLQLALSVLKCSCFAFLVESHLLTSCSYCKSPLGTATIFLKCIPNLSCSTRDMMNYLNMAKSIVLLVLFLLGVILLFSHGCWPGPLSLFPFCMFSLSLKRPPLSFSKSATLGV